MGLSCLPNTLGLVRGLSLLPATPSPVVVAWPSAPELDVRNQERSFSQWEVLAFPSGAAQGPRLLQKQARLSWLPLGAAAYHPQPE